MRFAMSSTTTTIMAQHRNVIKSTAARAGKETIHSGHFMVSQFEADAQDDEYEVAVPVPEVNSKQLEIIPIPLRSVVYSGGGSASANGSGGYIGACHSGDRLTFNSSQKIVSVSIETSLTKLFQCMSIAYRQKLTSPKWNRFKGIRLRWKEKIRLNNVIWRCWHMQFVLKRNIGVCQFASPLDVDIHSKPEAVVLEGKYWKRKLSAVTAEYKRWRLFYQKFASSPVREPEAMNGILDWNLQNSVVNNNMMVDEDYMNFMSDTLFSTLTSNQPFAFPDTREIARGASLADFIQPSLVQLQPNLDDYMDIMLEPLQDLLSPSSKLPSVPEEYHPSDDLYRSLNVNYEDMSSTAFYPQTTAAAMETTPPPDHSEQQKFFVKCEQEQPLQLSVSQNALDSKMSYRGNNANNNGSNHGSGLYGEPNPNTMFSNHRPNDGNSYSSYQTSTYQQLQSGQESVAINYSHQSTAKNVSSPITINFNNSPMTSSHHYSAYEPNMSYSAPTSNVSQYNPTSSRDYKILSTSRPLRTTLSATNPPEEELFVVPKLSQRGRSRSGSNLILNQGRYLSNDQCNPEAASSTHGYHSAYQPSNTPCCGTPNYDSRGCYIINGHRQVPYCAALLGRRSRTPDHILSTTSNPVGYCKPRIPSLSSQNADDGSLMNFSADKSLVAEKLNGVTHPHPYGSGRRFSQCLPKGAYEKYQHSTNHVQTWASTGSYQSTNLPSGQLSASGPVTPFIFTGSQQTHSSMDVGSPGLSHMMNHAATAESPKHPSSPSTSESLSLSPMAAGSPIRGTPPSPTAKSSVTPYKEHRRVCHINAEQKRRCNIKNGFDTLHMLIPHLVQNPNSKMSKAAMLQKGAEYIQQLRSERTQLREEIESLKQQVNTLNSAISNCQSMLPATGAPVSGHKADKMNELFDEYVRERTKQNWKFWILSLIVQPLLVSFNASVSTSSFEDLCRTTIQWAEQYCSLVDLRPIALNALRHLSAKTDAITNPHRLPDEVQAIVLNTSSKSSKN